MLNKLPIISVFSNANHILKGEDERDVRIQLQYSPDKLSMLCNVGSAAHQPSALYTLQSNSTNHTFRPK